MKKTLLATAIAATAMVAAGAQAATVYNQDGTKLDIYGNLQIAYKSVETAQYDNSGNFTGVDSDDEIFDNGSTIGLKGEHAINPGLTGYFKAEWEHDADEAKSAGGINTGDQAYMGLKGNFGDVRLGSWDQLIDDWVQDPLGSNEYFDPSDSTAEIVDTLGTDQKKKLEGDKVTYTSPTLGGFQFAVGTQYKGSAESDYLEGSGDASFFGGVKYAAGAFSVAAVYDNLENYRYLKDAANKDSVDSVGDQYGITGQYTWNTLRLALKLERLDSDQTDGDIDFAGLGARYGYGNGDLYGSYQNVDYDDSARRDRDEVVLGATYNISSALYTFVEAAWYDKKEDEGDGVAVGAVYMF